MQNTFPHVSAKPKAWEVGLLLFGIACFVLAWAVYNPQTTKASATVQAAPKVYQFSPTPGKLTGHINLLDPKYAVAEVSNQTDEPKQVCLSSYTGPVDKPEVITTDCDVLYAGLPGKLQVPKGDPSVSYVLEDSRLEVVVLDRREAW